jgi:hypothetical protein
VSPLTCSMDTCHMRRGYMPYEEEDTCVTIDLLYGYMSYEPPPFTVTPSLSNGLGFRV